MTESGDSIQDPAEATKPTSYAGPPDAPDRYALAELRSRGGEGELWRGAVTVGDQQLPVAVKVLYTVASSEVAAAADKLRSQAELLRSIDHPNIVKVREAFVGPAPHEQGKADSATQVLYSVMNWVEGEDLVTWVERHPQRDVLESTRIVTRLAAALDYLHRGEGTGGTPVLHRDIKPANVIIGQDGAVHLVDFGLARLASTNTMTMVGTPAYMAPEVVAGAAPTAASDRYGLGAVAFFLFTGEAPNMADLAASRAKLLTVKGIVDHAGFADHIMSMLSRDPAGRPADMIAWSQGLAIGTVSQSFGPATVTPTPPQAQPAPQPPAPPAPAPPPAQVPPSGPGQPSANSQQPGPVIPPASEKVSPGLSKAAPAKAKSKKPWLVWVIWVLVLALVAGGFATWWFVLRDTSGSGTDSQTTATGQPTASTSSTPPKPTATAMPSLVGLTLDDAKSRLDDLGIPFTVTYKESTKPVGQVLDQSPAAGQPIPTRVVLTVAKAPTAMPDTVGETLRQATADLEALGITVKSVDKIDESTADGTVLSQDPAAGSPIPNTATLTVARQPVITYVVDMGNVEGSWFSGGLARISGVDYTRSVFTDRNYGGFTGYDLRRAYREFRATVGLRDDSSSNCQVKFELFGDGRLLTEATVGLGQPVELSADVTGVLRLQMKTTFLNGGGTAVWGNARLLGAPGEVPTASPT